MNNQNVLTVNNIVENVSEKTGAKFKTVEFTAATFMGGKAVKSNLSSTRNIWDAREITLGDGSIQKLKADPLFNDLKKGDLVAGRIIRFDTTEYAIGDRTVNSWKGVVFDGEDAVKYANSQLKSKEATVVIDDIVVTNDMEAANAFSEKPILA